TRRRHRPRERDRGWRARHRAARRAGAGPRADRRPRRADGLRLRLPGTGHRPGPRHVAARRRPQGADGVSATGGTRAIIAALAANLGIAASQFVAFAVTGSASMAAEGVHSLADSGNQVLLLVGGRRALRPPDEEHPFGYGRTRYVYAFVVSI